MKDIAGFIRQHDRYLLLTHRRPDGDTLGSAAALCAGLRALGKTAYLWRNPEITARYQPFTEPYLAPEGVQYDKVISVDAAVKALLPEGWSGAVDLRIDHHPGQSNFAAREYTDPSAAACGEVVYDLLQALGVSVTAEIAALLYIAVSTDTGGFRYSNTTARTHRIAAGLIDAGADTNALNAILFAKAKGRMAAEAAILSNLRFDAGGLAAVASLSLAEKEDAGATEDDLENIAGLVQNIEGVSIGLILREEADNWRVSCRTAGGYEANRICQRLSDGGGHRNAAGGRIKGIHSPAEARVMALNALWETYPELRSSEALMSAESERAGGF
ncbi:MAG: bifunctional oligoribonuclease/PAP phosphatase NrnA [Oscillospiraceae bacterium]|jgi:phosphoesterase RecJ-like protein|nr:bifunctional oligoribonuclease/PAP phosphatase NrnA [Oscillospiraceae bacterium]